MSIQDLIERYVAIVRSLYGSHVVQIILYGSYARGDYRDDSDIDIMVLLDMSDMEIKQYQNELFDTTYDFNMDNDVEINPFVKDNNHFSKWADNYPFYNNIRREGKVLYNA